MFAMNISRLDTPCVERRGEAMGGLLSVDITKFYSFSRLASFVGGCSSVWGMYMCICTLVSGHMFLLWWVSGGDWGVR